MLRRLSTAVLVCVVAVSVLAAAPNMSLRVTSGKALTWKKDAGGWGSVRDSSSIAYSDSLYLDQHETATLALGAEAQVLLRGPCRVTVEGADLSVRLALVEGQLLLRRDGAHEFSSLTVGVRGCVLTPLGTAAAVKLTKIGEPYVAVLSGRMRMDAADGNSVTVDAGQFATYEIGKKFSQGRLQTSSIQALEEWSGMKYDGPAPAADESSAASQPVASAPEQPASASGSAAQQPSGASGGTTGQQQPASAQPSGGSSGEQAATTAQGAAATAPKADSTKAVPAGKSETGTAENGGHWKPTWALGASVATVDGKQWTMLNFGVELPIWRFGIFFDLEGWIDENGQFSNKDWTFDRTTWYRSVLSKIRYVRYGHEGDPFFVKLGGLDMVTLGYGFIVDRFTNMLHYPDQKLLGLQFELNNISPIGVSFQGLVADFYDFGSHRDGGVMAARLGFRFLKATKVPLLKDLQISGTYAVDRNMYAPARDYRPDWGPVYDRDHDGIIDAGWLQSQFGAPPYPQSTSDSIINTFKAVGDYDTAVDTARQHAETVAKTAHYMFQVVGGDIGMPIINGKHVRLELYAQAATRVDNVSGWGIGAPGLGLKVGPLQASVEYRHVDGYFEPGFFGTFYLDERLQEIGDSVFTKVMLLPDVALNGVYGTLVFNIADVVLLSGDYQYLMGGVDKTDQRYEATGGLGQKFIKHIPKLSKAEMYIQKTNVGQKTLFEKDGTPKADGFFDPSPYMYWGYRLGFQITQGASLIWETRHGYLNKGYTLVDNNTFSVSTAITF